MSGDPSTPAHEWEERAILYVDGGLTSDEAARMERELASSAELRRAVARVRVLRGLVADLPRRPCPLPAAPEEFLDATAPERREVTVEPAERELLRGLARVDAPDEIWSRIERGMRAEPRVARPASLAGARRRLSWRYAAAAALVMGLAAGLYSTIPTTGPISERPGGRPQFVFVYNDEPAVLPGGTATVWEAR